jgi:hypothetical protein
METQMHYECKTSHDSCMLFGCRSGVPAGDPPPTFPLRRDRPTHFQRLNPKQSSGRRRVSSGSHTPGARSPKRSASVVPPSSDGSCRTSRRSRCPGAHSWSRSTSSNACSLNVGGPASHAPHRRSEAARGKFPNRSFDESRPRTPRARASARSPASSTPTAYQPRKAAGNGGPRPSELCSTVPGRDNLAPVSAPHDGMR